MLCCRCHREVEYGLINKSEMEKKYELKWNEIKLKNPLTFQEVLS